MATLLKTTLLCLALLCASRLPAAESRPLWQSANPADAAEAQEIHDLLRSFEPIEIGDPIGPYGDYMLGRYYPRASAPYFGYALCGGALALLLSAAWQFRPKNRGRRLRRKVIIVALWTLPAALLALGVRFALAFYWGGPYDYANYRVPEHPADVLIWFSGSDDGAYYQDNYERACHEFGARRVALFNFSDMDAALAFAAKLPPGSRLVLRGHSMGASAAAKFAARCGREILVLDTRDATSWFGKIRRKPPNVTHWRNVLPEVRSPFDSKANHPGTNYICGLNMANVFMWMGGPWGPVEGAVNLRLEGLDHCEIGDDIDGD